MHPLDEWSKPFDLVPLWVPRNCPLKFPVLQPTSDQMVGRCLIMPIFHVFMVGVCPGHPPSDLRVLCTPSQEPQDCTGLDVGDKLGPGLSVTSNQTEPQAPSTTHTLEAGGCGGGNQSHAALPLIPIPHVSASTGFAPDIMVTPVQTRVCRPALVPLGTMTDPTICRCGGPMNVRERWTQHLQFGGPRPLGPIDATSTSPAR